MLGGVISDTVFHPKNVPLYFSDLVVCWGKKYFLEKRGSAEFLHLKNVPIYFSCLVVYAGDVRENAIGTKEVSSPLRFTVLIFWWGVLISNAILAAMHRIKLRKFPPIRFNGWLCSRGTSNGPYSYFYSTGCMLTIVEVTGNGSTEYYRKIRSYLYTRRLQTEHLIANSKEPYNSCPVTIHATYRRIEWIKGL